MEATFQQPNFEELVSNNQIKRIQHVKHFRDWQYSQLDIRRTLEFFTKRYVQQLYDFTSIDKETVIADVGAGYGWLGMSFAFCTPARVILIECDVPRLRAGREIAKILEIEKRIEWCAGSLGRLPLVDEECRVVYCIEVLEHVYRNPDVLSDLCRISRDLIVLTTPNLWFPIIGHDTRLPLCHWLPIPMRKMYARAFKRSDEENDNLFFSPYSLTKGMKGFTRVSKWLHYSSYDRFLATFPFYLPYGQGQYVTKLGHAKAAYYRAISSLGRASQFLTPSLAGVFRRNDRGRSCPNRLPDTPHLPDRKTGWKLGSRFSI